MRALITGLCLCLLAQAGCSGFRQKTKGTPTGYRPTTKPTPEALVAYLNRNARKVPGLRCGNVTLTASQDSQSVTLSNTKLYCEQPRNFRIRAKIVSSPQLDLGSNRDEFWFWIKQVKADTVFHCRHEALERGGVKTPFPFRPEMVMNALGIAEYDPNKKYRVEIGKGGETFELIEDGTSLAGQPVQKVTVFNARKAAPGEPQVLAYLLRDAKGNETAKASITQAQSVRLPDGGSVVLPRYVELTWPAQKMKMKLKLNGLQAIRYSAQQSRLIFDRGDLSSLRSFDLARQNYDSTTGRVRRIGHQQR